MANWPAMRPTFTTGERAGIGQHHRHLQEHAEEVADVVGAVLGEALGAIAALQQEGLAGGDARQAPSSGCAPRRRTPAAERSQAAPRRRRAPARPDNRAPARSACCASYRASTARTSQSLLKQKPQLIGGLRRSAYTQAGHRPPVGNPSGTAKPCDESRIRICWETAWKLARYLRPMDVALDDVFIDEISFPATDGYALTPMVGTYYSSSRPGRASLRLGRLRRPARQHALHHRGHEGLHRHPGRRLGDDRRDPGQERPTRRVRSAPVPRDPGLIASGSGTRRADRPRTVPAHDGALRSRARALEVMSADVSTDPGGQPR